MLPVCYIYCYSVVVPVLEDELFDSVPCSVELDEELLSLLSTELPLFELEVVELEVVSPEDEPLVSEEVPLLSSSVSSGGSYPTSGKTLPGWLVHTAGNE